MYNPSTTQADDSDLEWIELYNNGSSTANLENYTIDGNDFGDANISAYGYIIVARELNDGVDTDPDSFEAYYGNNDSAWNTSDSLTNYTAVDGDFGTGLGNTAPATPINLSDGTNTIQFIKSLKSG